MQTWQWRLAVLVVAAGWLARSLASNAAAPTVPNPAAAHFSSASQAKVAAYVGYYVARLRKAENPHQMFRARENLLQPLREKGNPPSAIFSNLYGTRIAAQLTPLLSDKRLALSAIITIAKVNDLSTQRALKRGLQNPGAAVRYWAGRGLSSLLPELEQIPPAFRQSVRWLKRALAKETDPIVMEEFCDTLAGLNPASTGAAPLMVRSLEKIIAGYGQVPPENLEVAAGIASDLNKTVARGGALTAKQKTAALGVLADLMSYAAQYWNAGLLNRTQKLVVAKTIAVCGQTMNAISSSQAFVIKGIRSRPGDPARILSQVNGLTGSQGHKGRLQKLFPKVAIPPRIPGDSTPPATR